MADIELVIKIPEEAKQAFDCAESNDLKGCYYNHGGVIGNAIKNGTPLPKGHGRLIDADEVIKIANKTKDLHGAIWNAPTIIEADKESEMTEKKLSWLGKNCKDCGNKKCKDLGVLPKGYDCALWQAESEDKE